jgi:hypothetical protein
MSQSPREIMKRLSLQVTSAIVFALLLSFPAGAQQANDGSQDKNFDVRSSVGDMHLGNDGNARGTGLPAYPGARLRRDDKNQSNANLGIFTSAFGVKLVIAHYDSDDSPDKVIAFYRDKLKRYGKVLECHTSKHGGDVRVNADYHDSDESKESDSKESDSKESDSKDLKCDDDKNGKTIELKAGTEDNQHLVAIEPADKGTGVAFALVYVHTRGKQGDI